MPNRCLLPVGSFSTVVVRAYARLQVPTPPLPSLGEGCDGKSVPLSNQVRATPVDEVRHKSQVPSRRHPEGARRATVRVSFPLSISRRLLSLTTEMRPSRRFLTEPPQGDARRTGGHSRRPEGGGKKSFGGKRRDLINRYRGSLSVNFSLFSTIFPGPESEDGVSLYSQKQPET